MIDDDIQLLATITEMKKYTLILTIILLTFSCKEKTKTNEILSEKQPEISKIEPVKIEKKIVPLSQPLIQETIGNKTDKTYLLGDLKIQLNQYKSDGTEFYCKSEIIVYKNGKQLDYADFQPEPVGGNYGISSATKFNNHLIFTKHGDYDGRTLIINDKGQIFDIIGGENYLDEESELLFTIYESDLSGFAVFDLKTDSILLTMTDINERPMKFHKNFGNKYFMSCINDETDIKSIWDIEFELERIMQVDLDETDINSENELKKHI